MARGGLYTSHKIREALGVFRVNTIVGKAQDTIERMIFMKYIYHNC